MQPVNFTLNQSFLVPRLSGSEIVSYSWNTSKLRHLVNALRGNTRMQANFDKMDTLSVELLVELFQKLNEKKRIVKGSKPLASAIYFDVTKLISSKELEQAFENGLRKSVGFVPPNLKTKKSVFYSFLTQEREKLLQKANGQLPDSLWGRVYSFLDAPATAESCVLASSFTSDAFLKEAFKGKEDELATKWARGACAAQEDSEIQLPATLHAIKSSVRKIDLSNLTLTPTLLKSFALLFPNVEELDLNTARLNAECIQALQDFPQLKVLSLKGRHYTYGYPIGDNELKHLQNCRSLEKLNISHTKATGAFFQVLPQTLKELNCHDCKNLKDESLIYLKDKTNLEKLDLSLTNITGTHFQYLPESLKELICDRCDQLKDSELQTLQCLTQLKKLSLEDINITGACFRFLPQSLEELVCGKFHGPFFDYNAIADINVQALENKTKLRVLHLGNQPITGECFHYLPESLEELVCIGCQHLNQTQGLQNKTKLKKLDLSHTAIKDENLATFPLSLKELILTSCNLTDEAAKKLTLYLQLEKLNLSYNVNIRGLAFEFLLPTLKELECKGCLLDDLAVKKLSHVHLTKLDISENVLITGQTFDFVSDTLKTLICEGNYQSDGGLLDVAAEKLQNKNQLEVLRISDNSHLTGKDFHLLPISLLELYCSGSTRLQTQLSDEAICGLQNKLKLKILDVSCNELLTHKNFPLLAPSIIELHIAIDTFKDEIIDRVKHLPLKKLNLDGALITGKTFDRISDSIVQLSCTGCKDLDPDFVFQYLSNKKHLKFLYLEESFDDETEITGQHVDLLPHSLRTLNDSGYHLDEAKRILVARGLYE